MTNQQLAERYAPRVFFDDGETIPLRAVGYTVARETRRSDSFPKRMLTPPEDGVMIEYAFYWNYDIQHMYDLEHVWVMVDGAGQVVDAEGSFHGNYLKLLPDLPCVRQVEDGHVSAFCQPGKHAFLPDGQLCRLLPDWREACSTQAGGGVLVGGPFAGIYQPTEEDDALSAAYLREKLAFVPTLSFQKIMAPEEIAQLLLPWEEMKQKIPGWIHAECERLRMLAERR